ncbi:hypothetical protein CTAM01_16718 [Colletotrichum tamarilloi]|uniref:Uncharacterized protein n=1 Tax=Colletotrichum tamarilloi TaxID=1209934 RepID=A0ABQ9QHS8_9PEZI|nr:uncharacterized protein CTAM01_16718 [Colletotrichum tamarilloi]KAK1470919.1 hypothetical protein CTAM01_16718 [Colletotrichum tamarilloi]
MITSRLTPLARFGLRCFPRLIAIPKRHRYPEYMMEAVRRWIRVMRLAIFRDLCSLRLRRQTTLTGRSPPMMSLLAKLCSTPIKAYQEDGVVIDLCIPRSRPIQYQFLYLQALGN